MNADLPAPVRQLAARWIWLAPTVAHAYARVEAARHLHDATLAFHDDPAACQTHMALATGFLTLAARYDETITATVGDAL